MSKKELNFDNEIDETPDFHLTKRRPKSGITNLRDTMRLDNSSARLVDPQNVIDESSDNILQNSPNAKGNEVQLYRETKKKRTGKKDGKSRQSEKVAVSSQAEERQARSFMDMFMKRQENQGPKEIELTDMTQTNKLQKTQGNSNDFEETIDQKLVQKDKEEAIDFDRDSGGLLRSSFESKQMSDVIFNDYGGFKFDNSDNNNKNSNHGNTRNLPMSIDLHSRDLSSIDIEETEPQDIESSPVQQKTEKQKIQEIAEMDEEYYYEVEDVDNEIQKEGGDEEDDDEEQKDD